MASATAAKRIAYQDFRLTLVPLLLTTKEPATLPILPRRFNVGLAQRCLVLLILKISNEPGCDQGPE